MGKRGTKPKSNNILKITGSRRAKPSEEPAMTPGRPDCPDWLGEAGKRKWEELIPHLEREGLMTYLYGDFIAQFCLAFEDMLRFQEIIDSEGTICVSDKGNEYPHPAVNLKINAIDRLRKFGTDFGLSPAAIRNVTRITKGADPLAASTRRNA